MHWLCSTAITAVLFTAVHAAGAAAAPSRPAANHTLVAEQPAPPAQPGTPRPDPGPAPPGILRAPRGQLVNVRIDVTISDQRGTTAPVTKNITLLVADGEFGRVRSTTEMARLAVPDSPMQVVPLNVDARPEVLENGRIRVQLSLEYDLVDTSVERGARPKTEIRESLTVILEPGKPLVISQSADPVGDRRVTVELKATVVK